MQERDSGPGMAISQETLPDRPMNRKERRARAAHSTKQARHQARALAKTVAKNAEQMLKQAEVSEKLAAATIGALMAREGLTEITVSPLEIDALAGAWVQMLPTQSGHIRVLRLQQTGEFPQVLCPRCRIELVGVDPASDVFQCSRDVGGCGHLWTARNRGDL